MDHPVLPFHFNLIQKSDGFVEEYLLQILYKYINYSFKAKKKKICLKRESKLKQFPFFVIVFHYRKLANSTDTFILRFSVMNKFQP